MFFLEPGSAGAGPVRTPNRMLGAPTQEMRLSYHHHVYCACSSFSLPFRFASFIFSLFAPPFYCPRFTNRFPFRYLTQVSRILTSTPSTQGPPELPPSRCLATSCDSCPSAAASTRPLVSASLLQPLSVDTHYFLFALHKIVEEVIKVPHFHPNSAESTSLLSLLLLQALHLP